MKLFIVRHGETESNNEDILQGQLDGRLSDRGWLQAKALAGALRSEKIDVIFSSDLERGKRTAEVIAKDHSASLIMTKDIRERNFGVFAGTNRSMFYEKERSLGDPYNHRPDGGESFADLYRRARAFLLEICEKYPQKSVLLVSHGDFARMCLGVLIGKTVKEACQIKQTNSCINIFEVGAKLESKALVLNSTTHLPGELKSTNRSDL